MIPFDAAEQAELSQAVEENLLPHVGEIRRRLSGATWQGVDGADAVPCLLTLVASGGNPIADMPGGAERVGQARLDVLPDVDLQSGDRMLVWALGRRFECELVAPPGVMFRTGYGRVEAL
jgi:hypothetical protein